MKFSGKPLTYIYGNISKEFIHHGHSTVKKIIFLVAEFVVTKSFKKYKLSPANKPNISIKFLFFILRYL